jgi:hypothetical protein
MGRRARPSRQWYRRPEVWLLVAAVVVPFGWVPALCRYAWSYASARRDRGRGPTPSESATSEGPDADRTPD